jgi:hypothetical protein
MVVERLVKYYPRFLDCYYNETYHCLIEQYLNVVDIQMLTDLRIFENIDYSYVTISTIKLSPVCRATTHINNRL